MKKTLLSAIAAAGLLMSCNGAHQSNEMPSAASDNGENAVIETIMSRRSVRDYLPQAVNRDTMNIIAKCGIRRGRNILTSSASLMTISSCLP